MPRPATFEAIARAFKIPTERVYRVAGLLPEIPETESFIEEVTHHIRQIQNPQRNATALSLIKALISEERREQGRK